MVKYKKKIQYNNNTVFGLHTHTHINNIIQTECSND